MNALNITLVQANQIWENKQANLENYERLLTSTINTDLILLPEMFNTGFSMNAEQLAEKMEDSPSIEWLKKVSLAKNAAIYTSLIVEDGDCFYNRGVFVAEGKVKAVYDKLKTFGLAGEDQIFARGDKSVIVNYKGWNIQLQICYDLRFPEITLNKLVDAKPEYDLLLYVANWPERRAMHWKNLLPARAIENQCYIAAVNRVGVDAINLNYSGDSCLLDLHGKEVIQVENVEQVYTSQISLEELVEMRQKLPFLKDRVV